MAGAGRRSASRSHNGINVECAEITPGADAAKRPAPAPHAAPPASGSLAVIPPQACWREWPIRAGQSGPRGGLASCPNAPGRAMRPAGPGGAAGRPAGLGGDCRSQARRPHRASPRARWEGPGPFRWAQIHGNRPASLRDWPVFASVALGLCPERRAWPPYGAVHSSMRRVPRFTTAPVPTIKSVGLLEV